MLQYNNDLKNRFLILTDKYRYITLLFDLYEYTNFILSNNKNVI